MELETLAGSLAELILEPHILVGHGLTRPFPPLGPFDIVFLRNVLIYFDAQTKARILDGVNKVTRPDGYLFLGAAETTLDLSDMFTRHSAVGTSYHRPAVASTVEAPGRRTDPMSQVTLTTRARVDSVTRAEMPVGDVALNLFVPCDEAPR